MINSKYKWQRFSIIKCALLLVSIVFVIVCVSCAIKQNPDESVSDPNSSSETESIAIELSNIQDQELEKELIDLAYINVEVQNGNHDFDLTSIYTEGFIKNTIEKDDDFYKKLKVLEGDKAPMAKYSPANDEYMVVVWLKSKEEGNAVVLEKIIIENDSSRGIKISDIQ